MALRLLSRRSHSREELARKLRRRAAGESVQPVLDRLTSLGYLNDEEFAFRTALRRRESQHWGNRRIRADLKRRGLGARMIGRALERVEETCPERDGLRQAVRRWIERSGAPTNPAQLKKLFDHCLRLGYSSAMARTELTAYFRAVDWSNSET